MLRLKHVNYMNSKPQMYIVPHHIRKLQPQRLLLFTHIYSHSEIKATCTLEYCVHLFAKQYIYMFPTTKNIKRDLLTYQAVELIHKIKFTISGCIWNNKCYRPGRRWRDGCTRMQCIKSNPFGPYVSFDITEEIGKAILSDMRMQR